MSTAGFLSRAAIVSLESKYPDSFSIVDIRNFSAKTHDSLNLKDVRALTLREAVTERDKHLNLSPPLTTYPGLASEAAALAQFMRDDLSVRPGDCVGVMLANSIEVITLHFACARVRATLLNLNTRLVARELKHALCNSGAVVVFLRGDTHSEVLTDALNEWNVHMHVPNYYRDRLRHEPSNIFPAVVAVPKLETSEISSELTDFSAQLEALGVSRQDFDWNSRFPCLTEAGRIHTQSPSATSTSRGSRNFMLNKNEIHRVGCELAESSSVSAHVYYTSGTTGVPKGVSLSHAIVSKHAIGTAIEMRLSVADVWLHVAPIFHLVDAFAVYAVTWTCATHVLLPEFRTESFLSIIEREGVTVSNVASTMIAIACADPIIFRTDVSSLRAISCGGCPLAPVTARRALSVFGCEFFLSYGMTECCGKISMSILLPPLRASLDLETQLELMFTSGRPFALMEVKLVNPETRDQTQKNFNDMKFSKTSLEVGEVCVRGPTVFSGYWQRPDVDVETFDKDGWLKTGDLAIVRKEGYIELVDRKKDMILCGGENVYCAEVEAALYDHPDVAQAAAFGLPHPIMGEIVNAVVTLTNNPSRKEEMTPLSETARPLNNSDSKLKRRAPCRSSQEHSEVVSSLVSHCRQCLSGFKVPSHIHVLESIPMSASGKVLKHMLRTAMTTEMYSTDSQYSLMQGSIQENMQFLNGSMGSLSSSDLGVFRKSKGIPSADLVRCKASNGHSGKTRDLYLAEPLFPLRVSSIDDASCIFTTEQSDVSRDGKVDARTIAVWFSDPSRARDTGIEQSVIKADRHCQRLRSDRAEKAISRVVVIVDMHDELQTELALAFLPREMCFESYMIANMSYETCSKVKCYSRESLTRSYTNQTVIQARDKNFHRIAASLNTRLSFRSYVPQSDMLACTKNDDSKSFNCTSPCVAADNALGSDCLRQEKYRILCQVIDAIILDSMGLSSESSLPEDDAPLMSHGLTSLGAVRLHEKLSSAPEVREFVCSPLPATLVFDHPTVEAIRTFVLAQAGLQNVGKIPKHVSLQHHEATDDLQSLLIYEKVNVPPDGPKGCFQGPLPKRVFAVIDGTKALLPDKDDGSHDNDVKIFSRIAESDAITIVPTMRWHLDRLDELNPHSRAPVFGGFLHDAHFFDAELAGLSVAEAIVTDPQQRLVLDACASLWYAFECYGPNSEALDSISSPFRAHCGRNDYWATLVGVSQVEYPQLDSSIMFGPHHASGGHLSVAAGRVSFALNLGGPAEVIDTACSSSLVAISRAREWVSRCVEQIPQSLSLQHLATPRGAFACGINLVLEVNWTLKCAASRMLSSDGRCKTLDANADGYVRAEACIAFRIVEQLSNRDLMTLAGVAVNQDGRSASLTAPNGPSQTAVALAASCDAREVTQTEIQIAVLHTHGTGTALGDPVEVSAAAAVAAELAEINSTCSTTATKFLTLAASKTTNGHAEPAAGALGLLSAHRELLGMFCPAFAHLRSMNMHVAAAIDFARLSKDPKCVLLFSVSTQITASATPLGKQMRGATGVSAFAFQGTNAHAILLWIPGPYNRIRKGVIKRSLHLANLTVSDAQRRWISHEPHAWLPCIDIVGLSHSRLAVFAVALNAVATVTLHDHVVNGCLICPASVFFEAAVSAAVHFKDEARMLASCVIPRPFSLRGCSHSKTVLDISICTESGALLLESTETRRACNGQKLDLCRIKHFATSTVEPHHCEWSTLTFTPGKWDTFNTQHVSSFVKKRFVKARISLQLSVRVDQPGDTRVDPNAFDAAIHLAEGSIVTSRRDIKLEELSRMTSTCTKSCAFQTYEDARLPVAASTFIREFRGTTSRKYILDAWALTRIDSMNRMSNDHSMSGSVVVALELKRASRRLYEDMLRIQPAHDETKHRTLRSRTSYRSSSGNTSTTDPMSAPRGLEYTMHWLTLPEKSATSESISVFAGDDSTSCDSCKGYCHAWTSHRSPCALNASSSIVRTVAAAIAIWSSAIFEEENAQTISLETVGAHDLGCALTIRPGKTERSPPPRRCGCVGSWTVVPTRV